MIAADPLTRPDFDHEALKEIFGHNPDALRNALRQLDESLASDLADLKAALQAHDVLQTELVAHRVKGAAMVAGANAVADASQTLEVAARNASIDPDWSALSELMRHITRAADALVVLIREKRDTALLN